MPLKDYVKQGAALPPGDVCQCLETFSGSWVAGEGMLLTSGRQRPGMLLTILRSSGQSLPPLEKNYSVQNVYSVKVGNRDRKGAY